MSEFIIEIETAQNTIDIETSFLDVINNIEIERYETFELQIVNTEKILASDLPDNIPMSKIIGNLHVSRIDGLPSFQTLDIDGGTP